MTVAEYPALPTQGETRHRPMADDQAMAPETDHTAPRPDRRQVPYRMAARSVDDIVLDIVTVRMARRVNSSGRAQTIKRQRPGT